MYEVPKRFEEASLEDWQEDHVLRMVADRYIGNLRNYFKEGVAPILFGTSGVGKTRMAAAIMNTLSKNFPGNEVTWTSASLILTELIDSRDMREPERYRSIKNRLINTDILILDDISTLRNVPRVKEYFWIILDERYSNMKSTILTGNFYGDANAIWTNLESTFTEPVVRRMKECGRTLTAVIGE